MKRKAMGVIFRYNRLKEPQLLVLSFKDIKYPYYRLPGGGVEKGETSLQGCLREIKEETGITNLTFIRSVGKVKYYKPYIESDVIREDFLFYCKEDLPDRWEYIVQGEDKDKGEIFVYSWIDSDSYNKIAPELKTHISKVDIPELFTSNKGN
ncbi:NUDIX domain-containing protein [Dethiothermospora halolimnae]|uniref:NUDIX domain-containing protein n=1 Tax=Dethiothermospora halolimnae TaxID=3114390 RepID=UPI003CCB7681